jgi:hypothetical protein
VEFLSFAPNVTFEVVGLGMMYYDGLSGNYSVDVNVNDGKCWQINCENLKWECMTFLRKILLPLEQDPF